MATPSKRTILTRLRRLLVMMIYTCLHKANSIMPITHLARMSVSYKAWLVCALRYGHPAQSA